MKKKPQPLLLEELLAASALLEELLAANIRLEKIASIIDAVDQRCMAADGPVTPTLEEITLEEMISIYKLAKGLK